MSTDDERADDPPPVTWAPVDHLPGQLPFDHLDYGDAEQLAELLSLGEHVTEEPLEMVDAPVQVAPPHDGTAGRPLPT